LYTYYKYSDIFLLMSEHEGFCVPILEAQFHDLPIISIGRTAVDDIIGPEQVVMDELNYLKIASAVSVVKNNKNYRKYLAMHGEKNLKRFEESSTDKKYINLIKVLK
jgi:glycosyltransferase involved in cell wall biosynthesis